MRSHSPDPIEVGLLPKRDGGFRRMATLTDRDAAAWHALAGRVARQLEPKLSVSILANRAVLAPDEWHLEQVGSALARARVLARGLARSSPLLLRTDVAGFYPSVTPGMLSQALTEAGACQEDARQAARFLDGWGSHGYAGLPIGPPGSAVLGNAVLAPVDRALCGVRFLRWCDDYVVAVPSERTAAEVLGRLDEALDRVDLSRAATKTRLTEDADDWLGLASAR